MYLTVFFSFLQKYSPRRYPVCSDCGIILLIYSRGKDISLPLQLAIPQTLPQHKHTINVSLELTQHTTTSNCRLHVTAWRLLRMPVLSYVSKYSHKSYTPAT
jgi:hypothetical protein